MGNNPSKAAGGSGSPSSPVPSHSSANSNAHPRKEQRIHTQTSRNSAAHASSHSSPLNQQTPSADISPTQKRSADDRMGNEQSRQRINEAQARNNEASGPVKVPRGNDPRRQRGPDSQFEPSGLPRDPDYIPHSNLNFPPRLPLPIGEEDHTPGSPIITPADISSVLNEDEVDGALPRQSSMLSNTTADDDDTAGDELQPYPPDGTRRTVPTLVQWKQAGDRIYVTGTFTSWNRKFRMHRE